VNLNILRTLFIAISSAAGVQFGIWRPRKAVAGSLKARAYAAIRLATVGEVLAYTLLILLSLAPGDPAPALRIFDDGDPQFVISLVLLGVMLISPLASVAGNVDRGRQLRALFYTFLALLFAAGLTWFAFGSMVRAIVQPDAPFWREALLGAATLLSGGATASVLEAYVAIRQPRSLWDEA
jgi:hypothetical protein